MQHFDLTFCGLLWISNKDLHCSQTPSTIAHCPSDVHLLVLVVLLLLHLVLVLVLLLLPLRQMETPVSSMEVAVHRWQNTIKV